MSTAAVLTIAFVIYVPIVGVMIVLQRRSAAATMAWLMAIAFMPFIGFIIYRFIGPMRLERKRQKIRVSRAAVAEATGAMLELREASLEHAQLARVAIGLGQSPPLRASEVELFLDGQAAYAAILEAVRGAQHHIHMEYYIWLPDQIGTRLRDALCERARAGVQVRLVLDGLGARASSKNHFLAPLHEAGAEVEWFNPVRLALSLRRPDFRSHRKIVVVDGAVGFTGGMNVCDAHSQEFGPTFWRDTHLKLVGSAVWALQRLFLEDWQFVAERMPPMSPAFLPQPAEDGAHIVQIVGSGPDAFDFAIHKAFFTAIAQSTRRLWLTTPYFVPDESILTAIVAAALRKVDVRLLVPKKSDSKLVDLAARSYFSDLLDAGVRVFEYEQRFIHAKTMVVDSDVSIVGTANLDNRSFRLNFELAALIFDEGVNTQLATAFEADLTSAREVPRARPSKLPFWPRFGQAAARLLSPLL